MEQYNRVEAAWEKWQEREKRMAQRTHKGLSENRPFQKEKLAFLENLQVRYAGSMTYDEKLMNIVLEKERRDLRQSLYPNRLIRVFRNLVAAILIPQKVRIQEQTVSQNMDQLSASLMKLGFGEANSQMVQHIKEGRQTFSIPVSHYHAEKERVDYNLNFKRNDNGQFEFINYNTTLINAGKVIRSHTFTGEQHLGLTHQEMSNFLAGRPVLKQEPFVPWSNERWMQLDLTDRDADGNHRMKVIMVNDAPDFVNQLTYAGITEMHTGMDIQHAARHLKQGDQVKLSINKDGVMQTYLLEANPLQKSINVYDERNRKTTIEQVLPKAKTSAKIVPLVNKAQSNKLRTKKGKRLSP